MGKICFNKFKNFFDLPFNKNLMNQTSQIIENQVPPNLCQTFISSDIKYSGTNLNNKFMCSNNTNFDMRRISLFITFAFLKNKSPCKSIFHTIA